MTNNEIDQLRTHYRALQAQIPDIGFIALGSVIERYTVCGAPNCRCQAEPPAKHGPYFQYSRKLDGKTLTRRLTTEQAERYRGWISNRRALDLVIDQMDQLSRQIADLLDNTSARAKTIKR